MEVIPKTSVPGMFLPIRFLTGGCAETANPDGEGFVELAARKLTWICDPSRHS